MSDHSSHRPKSSIIGRSTSVNRVIDETRLTNDLLNELDSRLTMHANYDASKHSNKQQF